MDVQTAAMLMTAIATGVLAFGIWFAYLQVRHLRNAQAMAAALNIYEMTQLEHNREALNWLRYEFNPEAVSYEAIYADRTKWTRLSDVNHYFELVGTLVSRGYVPKDLVFDLMGMLIRGSWEKVEPIVQEHRRVRGAPTYMENFEWLQREFLDWAQKHPPKFERGARGLTSGYYRHTQERE